MRPPHRFAFSPGFVNAECSLLAMDVVPRGGCCAQLEATGGQWPGGVGCMTSSHLSAHLGCHVAYCLCNLCWSCHAGLSLFVQLCSRRSAGLKGCHAVSNRGSFCYGSVLHKRRLAVKYTMQLFMVYVTTACAVAKMQFTLHASSPRAKAYLAFACPRRNGTEAQTFTSRVIFHESV